MSFSEEIKLTRQKAFLTQEQFAKEIADYVIKNCKKIDSKYGFDVYYKK